MIARRNQAVVMSALLYRIKRFFDPIFKFALNLPHDFTCGRTVMKIAIAANTAQRPPTNSAFHGSGNRVSVRLQTTVEC